MASSPQVDPRGSLGMEPNVVRDTRRTLATAAKSGDYPNVEVGAIPLPHMAPSRCDCGWSGIPTEERETRDGLIERTMCPFCHKNVRPQREMVEHQELAERALQFTQGARRP